MTHPALVRVLHVDDDPCLGRLVAACLRGADACFEVEWVADAEAGLARLHAGNFDVVAVDHHLPGLSGLDLLRVAKIEGTPPVVVLTAVDEVGLAVRCMKEGAADYVVKDCARAFLDLLPHVLSSVVEKHRLEAERRTLLEALAHARDEDEFDVICDLVARDPLTGVANRRFLDVVLAKELQHAAEREEPIALLLCDLDHFKPLNDEGGHMAGDDALRRVASTLEGAVRGRDLVARYGGDEFVVVLPGCPPDVAEVRARGLCSAVRQLGIASASGRKLTMSVGVGAFPRGDAPELATLIQAADTALYRAKRLGRDRAATATAQRPPSERRSFSSLGAAHPVTRVTG